MARFASMSISKPAKPTYIGMALCCHWCMENFTGRVQFVFEQERTTLLIASTSSPWQPGVLDLAVTLRCHASWMQWCLSALSGALSTRVPAEPDIRWDIDALDCHAWALRLPGTPLAISLQRLCGFFPLQLTISQRGAVLGMFDIQRRAHCVHLNHNGA